MRKCSLREKIFLLENRYHDSIVGCVCLSLCLLEMLQICLNCETDVEAAAAAFINFLSCAMNSR